MSAHRRARSALVMENAGARASAELVWLSSSVVMMRSWSVVLSSLRGGARCQQGPWACPARPNGPPPPCVRRRSLEHDRPRTASPRSGPSGLTKRYGRTSALAGIDLEVPRGTVFGYLGPNGAGKTTTIRILAGLMRPTSGRAEVFGHDVVTDREHAQRCIGYLPGDFAGYPDLTGHAVPPLPGQPARRRRLGRRRVPRQAARSRPGRADRRALPRQPAEGRDRAGVHARPRLLILDEPTSGLDPLVQREFLQLVREVRDRGRTVFLSSHILSEVEAVADVVAILRKGRLVVTDTVANLEHQAVRRLDLVFAGAPPVAELAQVPGVHDVQATERTIHLAVEGSTAELIKAAAPYGVENVVTHEPDLEDVFLGWYDAEEPD